MMKTRKYKLLLIFLLLRLFSTAQTAGFQYEARVETIGSPGFHNIILTPIIKAHLKVDYSDLRIVNDSGKWIPHLTRFPNSEGTNHSALYDLKIIRKNSDRASTDVIVQAMDTNTSNLEIDIKNTVAQRYCSLSGSDDQSSWFSINDSIIIAPEKRTGRADSYFTLNFPQVNYKYFRILIYNNGKEPLNILRAGSLTMIDKTTSPFQHDPENPAANFHQLDSGNRSYIRVTQALKYHIDKLSLALSGAKYYHRNAHFYMPRSDIHSFSNPGELINSFIVSNNSTLEFNLPSCNPGVFYIIIDNEDNLPLKVEKIRTYSRYSIATAWLEKKDHYKLLMGNSETRQPNYDLQLSDIDRGKQYPLAVTANITARLEQQITGPADDNKYIMWLVILLAVCVLGFFTWKLIRDMQHTKT